MSKLVIGRTQKVKIILSKPIFGDLSFVSNPNCTFSPSITMIDTSTAQFTILPNPNTSLTIQTNNIITQDLSESVLSHTFNLVYEQTIVNLFESSNKHLVKTTFDLGTTVALSLEMSKEISSDLTGTTITCSNATVANVSISTISGKYYYNFNFTPTAESTNQTINVNQAKDLNNFKYNLSQSGLTFINPYTFPTSFNFSATAKNRYYGQGYLSQGISSSLILTFIGGDNLHSNSVATQISYVMYIQDSVEYIITDLSCSSEEKTITINSITPLSSNNLTIKVVLKSPNGLFFSNEIIGTISSVDFAIPITSVNVTSPIPSPNKLVSNTSVNLSFNFNTASAFSSQVLSSFSATVNDNTLKTLPLTFATASGVSLIVPYAAVSTSKHTFVFSAFNQQFTFVIESSEIYTYPTIIKTTRNIPTITLGETLTLTSHFLSVLPSFMTSTVIVTPFGYSSPSPFVQTYVGTISAGSLLDVTTPTWYYPFTTNIQNYASGVGVTDATIGVGGNTTGGNATFNDGLVLTGSSIHNAPGASYIVLPSTSSGNTAAFSCWFKSNNNGSFTRIIDMATNGSFRLYVNGSNSLNFNDVYTINTATTINNNTWNFIAINATATTLSWVLNSGDAGNYGSGSISSKPVNFNNSVGYLGHSFGGDPEFAGSLKQVCFYANANLTSQQISALYMGTTRVSISHKVEKDVNHSASVTLNYGSTNKPYNWGSDTFTLTSSNIYTFPDTFIIDGTSNGYVGGAYLKAGATGSLKLTFSGGDMLYSDSASTQISYVKYVQSGVPEVIAPNLLSSSDLLETITISGIKPTDTTNLTISVKLIGPDGIISAEISKTVFTSQFEVVDSALTFRTAGGIQNTTSTGTLLLNGTQWKNANNSIYQAAVLNKAFIGDFNTVIKFGSDYSALAMLCSQYASPMDFKDINREYYKPVETLQNFQPTGAYSYSIPIHFYNSATFYAGSAFANTSTTHYKYTRSGNYISISYCNTSATGPWTLISSATIQSTDLVICLIGQCAGGGGANQIATIIPEPGLIVWLDGSDPLGTGTAPADNTTITSWIDKSGNNKHCVPVTTNQIVQIYKESPTNSTPSIINTNLTLLLDAGNVLSYPGTGTTWTDLSGNNNTGIFKYSPIYKKSNGGYINLNGVNNITGTIQASAFNSAHTISCWFYRITASSWNGIFSNSVGINGGSMLTFPQSSTVLGTFQMNVNGLQLAVSIDLGADHTEKWIYATIVYCGVTIGSAVKMYVYKDGNLLTATGSLYWNLASSSSYYIGKLDELSSFNGYIPHFAVYNRELTATEISQNYNALKGRYLTTITKKGCISFPGNLGISRVPFTANTFPYSSYTISVLCKVTGGYDTGSHAGIVSGPTDPPYILFFGMWGNTFQIYNHPDRWAGNMNVANVGTNTLFTMNNIWAHLCITYTGGIIQPYVNGVAMKPITSQQAITSDPDIKIGGNGVGAYRAMMSLAELRIYSTVLSSIEVENLDSYLGKKYLY
jgi:hypothetical protein